MKRPTYHKKLTISGLARPEPVDPSDTFQAINPKAFELLVRWLNSEQDSGLHRMVEELQQLDRLASELDWSSPRSGQDPVWLEYRKLGESISSRMISFATYSAVAPNYFLMIENEAGGFEARRRHPTGNPYDLVRHPVATSSQVPEIAVAEWQQRPAFRAFEMIVETRTVGRLRKCDIDDCQRWFFAKKDNQLYCCARCRKRRHDRSPKHKAWRLDYREKMKSKNVL